MLFDTHAHIQLTDYPLPRDEVLAHATAAGVGYIMAVGVDIASSRAAIELASQHQHIYASIGLHPHDAAGADREVGELRALAMANKVVAIGECGLDYSRPHDKALQARVFRAQIELALEHNLPLIFHVRDAFSDFFKVVNDYPSIRGLVHCFNNDTETLQLILERSFSVALNGIMTFTQNSVQLEAARQVPLDRLVLETDCPFLTPIPYRGQPNQPAYLRATAEFLADLRGESFDDLATATTANAKGFFGLN